MGTGTDIRPDAEPELSSGNDVSRATTFQQDGVASDLVHRQLGKSDSISPPHGGFAVTVVTHSRSAGSAASVSAASEAGVNVQLPDSEDYVDPSTFLSRQKALREKNLITSGGLKTAMLSHCWRCEETQLSKRKIVAYLAQNGWSFWADFMDLQAKGPIPWRSEIEEGIRDSAKVIAFIDKAYLLSFNCLQELAFARLFSKPIVVIILEQEAVDLLTRPDGAASVWEELRQFEGKPLTPGSGNGCPLSELEVASLFEMLSSINFCMSRPLDFANDTDKVILRRVNEFVSVELAYQKEHALLQTRALEWESHGYPGALLLQKGAVLEKKVWIRKAHVDKSHPPPTELQERFVAASAQRAQRTRRILQGLMVLIFMVISGLGLFALYQSMEATRTAKEARRQEQLARSETVRANEQTAIAEQRALVATTWLYLFHARQDELADGFAQAAIREASAQMDKLPPDMQKTVLEAQTSMVRQLEVRTVGYPKARWRLPETTPYLFILAGDVSHDQRWIGYATALGTVGVVDTQSGAMHFLSLTAEFMGVQWIESASGGRDRLLVIDTTAANPRVLEIHLPEDGVDGASLEWEEVVTLDFTNVGVPGPLNTAYGVFNSDGSKALIGFSKTDSVALFDLADGSNTALEQIGDPGGRLNMLAWSADQRSVARARGSNVRVWDLETNTDVVLEHPEAEEEVNQVTFSPDGRRVVTRTAVGVARVWNLDISQQLAPPLAEVPPSGGRSGQYARWTEWSPDGTRIAMLDDTFLCIVYEAATGKIDVQIQFQEIDVVTLLRWSTDSRQIYAFYMSAGLFEVFSIDPRTPGVLLEGHTADVSSVRWNRAKTHIVSVSKDDNDVRIFTVATATSRALDRSNYAFADFAPDGSRIVAVGEDGVVSVHGLETAGTSAQTLGIHPDIDPLLKDNLDFTTSTFTVAWSPNGVWIASVGTVHKSIGLWNVADGSVRSIPYGVDASRVTYSSAPSWSSDSEYVAVLVASTNLQSTTSATSAVIVLIRVQDGSVQTLSYLSAVSEIESFSLAFSPDGSTIAAAGDGSLHLLRKDTSGQWKQHLLGAHVGIRAIAWSADSKFLYTASQEGTVRLWEINAQCQSDSVLVMDGLNNAVVDITTTSRTTDDGQEETLAAVTDGERIRLLTDMSKHSEVIARQSAAISLEELQQNYGIRDSQAACVPVEV